MFEKRKARKRQEALRQIEFDKEIGTRCPDQSFLRPEILDTTDSKVLCKLIVKAGNNLYKEMVELETHEYLLEEDIVINNVVKIGNCDFRITSFIYENQNRATLLYQTGSYWSGAADVFDADRRWEEIAEKLVVFVKNGWQINKWRTWYGYPITDC